MFSSVVNKYVFYIYTLYYFLAPCYVNGGSGPVSLTTPSASDSSQGKDRPPPAYLEPLRVHTCTHSHWQWEKFGLVLYLMTTHRLQLWQAHINFPLVRGKHICDKQK